MDKSNIINKEMQRAQELIEHQDNFIVRNYWLWVVVAFVLYPLAAIFSGLTEGGHVLIRMQTAMGTGALPVIITILIVILVELPKYVLGKGAVDDIQAGVFSDGGAKLALFIVKALGFIGIMIFSVALSIKGAPEINKKLRKQFTPLSAEYINLDTINAKYDAEAAPHLEKIANYEDITWKNKIVGDARTMIINEQEILSGIEERRNTELADARAENQLRRKEYEAKTAENGNWSMGFAGLGEVICLFALLFIGIYDDGLKAQAKSTTTPLAQSSPTPSGYNGTNINMAQLLEAMQQVSRHQSYTQVPTHQHPTTPKDDSNRRPIGFQYGKAQVESPSTSTISDGESAEDSSPLPWQQQNRKKAFNVVQRALNVQTDGTKLVDTRYFKSRMKQTYQRSFEYETEEARHYQHCLYQYFRAELEEIGWQISEEESSRTLTISEA